MLQNSKVSIIVPVYNVEKYINKCVMSLINQTYKNFEILLIDDGSTDLSGKICDNYSKDYYFIRTFHKQNGGASEARNYAMSYVTGEYITFVDSDDYVEIDFLEKMINLKDKKNADLVIVTHIDETPEGEILTKKRKRKKEVVLLTTEEAIEKMCYEIEFGTTPCAKLFKTDIVRKNPFPLNNTYEDLATVYKYIAESKKIVFYDIPMYHYVQRNGSKRNDNIWKNSVLDVMRATDELFAYIVKYYPNIYSAAVQRYFFSANEVYVRAFNNKEYLTIIAPFREKGKKLIKDMIINFKITLQQKIRYLLMIYNPKLYRIIWKYLKMFGS